MTAMQLIVTIVHLAVNGPAYSDVDIRTIPNLSAPDCQELRGFYTAKTRRTVGVHIYELSSKAECRPMVTAGIPQPLPVPGPKPFPVPIPPQPEPDPGEPPILHEQRSEEEPLLAIPPPTFEVEARHPRIRAERDRDSWFAGIEDRVIQNLDTGRTYHLRRFVE